MWLDKRWSDVNNVARKEAQAALQDYRAGGELEAYQAYEMPDWLKDACVGALQGEEAVFVPAKLKVRVGVSEKDVEMGNRERGVLRRTG